ncbi:Phosphatidylinositol 3- and 4-kinase family protein [Tritrichomonas foetus]|uniref:Phosphatidylinositol 3- and 4-kinase family protein n=1 Tax=Tritrichomonas foetus TaxID=1144522 RepID=A0A1J4KN20_9EUKA|nr:Phosphatidylinositol 3- and 4-kinase family protein [Tritrichomonas foetus]|eukprot:OHT11196.1 Phosphatidylinositol 3- and 4-kinase family protein [Tritrichomonas foetus]
MLSQIFSNKQLFAINIHRIDVVLPHKRNFSIPLVDGANGADIIKFIEKENIRNYVICRNSQNDQFYEILYVDNNTSPLINQIKLQTPFQETSLSSIFVPNMIFTMRHQRMALFVFFIQDYIELQAFRQSNIRTRDMFRKKQKVTLNIRIQSNLIIPIKINLENTVFEIGTKIHKRMKEIYRDADIKGVNDYRLGTVTSYYPKLTSKFGDDPVLMSFLQQQNENPTIVQFIFIETFKASYFDKETVKYINELDLSSSPSIYNEETRALNTKLSEIRSRVEKERIEKLKANPLIARMRISDSEPPLPFTDKISYPISISIEVRSDIIRSESLTVSIRVSSQSTVSNVIKQFIKRLKRIKSAGSASQDIAMKYAKESATTHTINSFASIGSLTNSAVEAGPLGNLPSGKLMSSDDEDDSMDDLPYMADDFVFALPGVDEILAGNTPMLHFVCVRQFILAQQPILNLVLVDKKDMIESIRNKELGTRKANPEPGPESSISIIQVTKPSRSLIRNIGYLSHSQVNCGLEIEIYSCIDLPVLRKESEYVLHAYLINGTAVLCPHVVSTVVAGKSNILFNQTLTFSLPIRMIPRSARVAFTLYDARLLAKNDKKAAIATYNFAVYTFSGWMNTGKFIKKMWVDRDTDFFLTTCESNELCPISLVFYFPKFKFPVAFVPPPPISDFKTKATISVSPSERKRIHELKSYDPLYVLTQKDKDLLYRYRTYCFLYPELLPLMLSSINFREPDQVNEIPLLLNNWEEPTPTTALTLLDAKFADHNIRAYAVNCLENFTDNELMLYSLQLVQALKAELYDDSPLVEFLFRRGLAEPKFLGHQLFWQLMSEAHISHIRQRFSTIVVNFLYGLGNYSDELVKGYLFTKELVKTNQLLSNLKYNEAQEFFSEALSKIKCPEQFHLPINPRLIVSGFVLEKCRVMNSKKKPFFLTFKNAAPFATEDVMTLFKVGDDLRQDQLTLQIMKIMEHLWRTNGQDLQLRCYGVLPTGFNQGFIEVVPNAKTESQIQQEKGIISGVLTKETFTNFLRANNPTPRSYERAKENFRKSSAGYAVATCVLGIADRHPGNIMVQKDGHFFHIDFGHFLGNFKTKLGYQRENAPFHFSPACAYVLDDIGGETFKKFEQEAAFAFNVLRHNAPLMITLLLLMLGTGIPELSTPSDVQFLKEKLLLDKTDEEAAAEFSKLTKISMESTKTMLNNFFHNLKTG